MGKTLIFIIFGPLLLSILFWRQNNGVVNNFVTETYSLKSDSSEGKKCTDCHSALYEKNIKHPVSAEKGCADCHQGNGSEHPKTAVIAFSLVEKAPDLCFTCHSKIKNLIASSPIVHQAVNQDNFCLNCHSPHSSTEKKLLVSNKQDMCFSCHNKTITTKTKTLSNMEQLFKSSKTIHPPFKRCSQVCHNAHGSANNNLLNIPFPEDEYVPADNASFGLCFECHDSEKISDSTTTTATNFRNGDKNLHFVHINGEKGRKCTMCHNVHATNNQHLIKDKVKFGSWDFNMNHKSNETGGSCLPGCHNERKYYRLILNPDSVRN